MTEMFFCPACHSQKWKIKGSLSICCHCLTEVIPQRKKFSYTMDYQEHRGHYEQEIRENKVQSFLSYLQKTHIEIKPNDVILEVGFGGGAVLEHLWRNQQTVFGIEAHEAAFSFLLNKKFPREWLFTQIQDVSLLKKQIDLVLYLDSFEHLLEPDQHLSQLSSFVKKGSRAIVVAPRVDSPSRHLLGTYWPHNVEEHWIFYSQEGLKILWQRHGWKSVCNWSPQKKISIDMVLRHFSQSQWTRFLQPFLKNFNLWVSMGEMGVVFEKI